MPLAHKLSSMIFIMPNHVEPLERVEKLLNREQLKTWAGKMKKRSVAISLPKVVLEVSHDLQVKKGLKENIWALQFFGVGEKRMGYLCPSSFFQQLVQQQLERIARCHLRAGC